MIDAVTHFNFVKKCLAKKGGAIAPLETPLDTPMGTTMVSVTALDSRGQ